MEDPLDGDIKRLCSEILGVGMSLEILRKKRVIDGREWGRPENYKCQFPSNKGMNQAPCKHSLESTLDGGRF